MNYPKTRKSTKSVLRTMSKMERNIWNKIKLYPFYKRLNKTEQNKIGQLYLAWIRKERENFWESIENINYLDLPPLPTEDFYFKKFAPLISGLVKKIRKKNFSEKEKFIAVIENMNKEEFKIKDIKELKERELFLDKLEKHVKFAIGGLQAFEKFLQDSLKL